MWLKDESNRLGLPAFKVLGASWAVERALREHPDVHTLVAASAGNHGRAVAHVAAARGLRARVFLPPARWPPAARRSPARAPTWSSSTARTRTPWPPPSRESARDGRLEISDVGGSRPAAWVIDGYATLFAEAAEQAAFDVLLVPVGVGSLAAAAARYGAHAGVKVVGVEPVAAACLTASLAAGEPVRVDTPGTAMAGLDCAEVSAAAWPSLRAGIHGTVTVDDEESRAAMRALAAAGLAIGDSGAAALAALTALLSDPDVRRPARRGRPRPPQPRAAGRHRRARPTPRGTPPRSASPRP